MARNTKIYRTPLREDWAQALLSATSQEEISGWRSVAKRLEEAKIEMQNAIKEAAAVISHNPLMQTVANAAAKEEGKRGDPVINIDENGTIMLEVYSKFASKVVTRLAALPALSVLRVTASELHIDISEMGRSKKKIMAAIDAKRLESQKGQKKRTKMSPALVVAADTGLTQNNIFGQPAVSDDILDTGDEPTGASQVIRDADKIDLDAILKP